MCQLGVTRRRQRVKVNLRKLRRANAERVRSAGLDSVDLTAPTCKDTKFGTGRTRLGPEFYLGYSYSYTNQVKPLARLFEPHVVLTLIMTKVTTVR